MGQAEAYRLGGGSLMLNLMFRYLKLFLLCGLFFGVAGVSKAAESGSQIFVFPNDGAYCGAYIDFGTAEDKVTLEAIEKFDKMVGRPQAIIASSSFWGELSFPAKNIRMISRYGAIPLIFWSPWDRPYTEWEKPDRFSLNEILAGKWDAYIDQWAIAAKEIEVPFLVSWGCEMNGNWFPWSGVHYGGGTKQGAGFEGPETYKRAFRYVVDRVRGRGATNILWGFHVNDYTFPEDGWNRMGGYYPGSEYVDWLGISVYGKLFGDEPWSSFKHIMEEPYHELCAVDTSKPILVAEYGVGEFPGSGDKAEWITGALNLLKTHYTRVRGALYWHERWPNPDGTYSNLRINSSPESLAAYRKGISDPFWLDRPRFIYRKPDITGRRVP